MSDIKKLIIEELLPFVNKPGRLTGNELGVATLPWEGRVSIALAFPDLYDLGMSNLGLAILYNIVNKSARGRAERVFAVAEDVAEVMRKKNIPLFSLETKTPIAEFDVLGFNSATELNFTNILEMLSLAGLPLQSWERKETDPLVIIGGACVFNPEPLADFADLFFIGDAEEAIVEMIDILHGKKHIPRREKIQLLSKIDGVYVPTYYEASYNQDGKYLGLKRLNAEAPEKIKARIVKQIRRDFYPEKPLVPTVEVVHDRLAVEIMRGCAQACRFCQATVIYKPARARQVDDIISQAMTNLENSGYDEVTLLSLSSGDHPEIETLVRRLTERLNGKRVALALPSLRVSGLSLELAELITAGQKSGLTFAPEAGTERLRRVINKPLAEETLLEVLGEAYRRGWQTIKLYFMIGLPTETEDDLKGIADLIRRLRRLSEKFRGTHTLNITISTFSPKPHTCWQWERQISIEENEQKCELLRKLVRDRNVNLKFHDPRSSWLEGILTRGDRRLGRVIADAHKLGAKMDGWSEGFRFDLWIRAFQNYGIDPDSYLRERSTAERLPWDHIEKGFSRESLLRDLAQSRGLLEMETSLDRETPAPKRTLESRKESATAPIAYGRGTKTTKASSQTTVPQSRLRIRWGRSGLARFFSHLDNMRALERTLRRAGFPLSFSQGYNPRPKLSFGPPLALGYTSEAEYFDVQLEAPVQRHMIDRLSREFPPDYNLLGTKVVFGKASSLSAQINLAIYQIDLPLSEGDCHQRIDRLISKDELKIMRETKAGPVEVQARQAILELSCAELEPNRVRLTAKTGMGDLGFIKPTELLEYGFELGPEIIARVIIHRLALLRMAEGKLYDPFDLI